LEKGYNIDMTQMEYDDLIIGGGWSGLWAANFLFRQGRKTAILEKEGFLGGLARTIARDDFLFDCGGHRLILEDRGLFQEVSSLLKKESLRKIKKVSKIFFRDRYIDHPLTLGSLAAMDTIFLAKGLWDLYRPKRCKASDSFATWARHHYGHAFYEAFFKEYSEKVWGLDGDELSADWAERRIGRFGIKAFLHGQNFSTDAATDAPRHFYYPEGGIGSLIHALEKELDGKCPIFKNCRLQKFLFENHRLHTAVFSDAATSHEIKFRRVFSSIPLPELFAIEPFSGFAKNKEFLSGLRYRSLLLVCVTIAKPMATPWHWAYYPLKKIIFSRLHEPKFWSAALARDPQKTLVCAEIFCDFKDPLWNSPDKELVHRTCDGMKQAGLLKSHETVSDFFVTRVRYAYPLHFKNYKKPLSEATKTLGSFENLELIGRSGTHSYYDLEQCLQDVLRKTTFKGLDKGSSAA
jgi:protoporphyrinogen oxidase